MHKRRGWRDEVPPTPGTQNQPGWGGIVYNATSGPVTSVTASFTVPSLSGSTGALASIWVGIGNVMQTGIYAAYYTGYPGDIVTSPHWTWFLGGGVTSQFWDPSAYYSSAGDALTLTLAVVGDYWVATQVNATQGWSYASSTPTQSVNSALGQWNWPYNTAEVIIENEKAAGGGTGLPDYGTLTFSNIATVPALVTADLTYITTVNTHTDQTPGTYSGGAFTMTWANYD